MLLHARACETRGIWHDRWTSQTVIKLADPGANQTEPWGGGNRTFGGGLASGIALKGGPHQGRLLAALRHDCGCGDRPASFVVYSDDVCCLNLHLCMKCRCVRRPSVSCLYLMSDDRILTIEF